MLMACMLVVSCIVLPVSATTVSVAKYDETTEKPTCWKCHTQGVFVGSWPEYNYYYTRIYSEFICPNENCDVVSWVMSVDVNNINGEEDEEYEVASEGIDPVYYDVNAE